MQLFFSTNTFVLQTDKVLLTERMLQRLQVDIGAINARALRSVTVDLQPLAFNSVMSGDIHWLLLTAIRALQKEASLLPACHFRFRFALMHYARHRQDSVPLELNLQGLERSWEMALQKLEEAKNIMRFPGERVRIRHYQEELALC